MTNAAWWTVPLDRNRLENVRQGQGGEEKVVSMINVEKRTGTGWRMVDRERVEKKREVRKDNVKRRTGRGWRKGE